MAEGEAAFQLVTALHWKLPSGGVLLPQQVEWVLLRFAKSALQVGPEVFLCPHPGLFLKHHVDPCACPQTAFLLLQMQLVGLHRRIVR